MVLVVQVFARQPENLGDVRCKCNGRDERGNLRRLERNLPRHVASQSRVFQLSRTSLFFGRFRSAGTATAMVGPGALAATLMIYGATESLGGYGFLAVFVGALAIRSQRREHRFHQALHSFSEMAERLLTAVILFALGGAIAGGLLASLDTSLVIFRGPDGISDPPAFRLDRSRGIWPCELQGAMGYQLLRRTWYWLALLPSLCAEPLRGAGGCDVHPRSRSDGNAHHTPTGSPPFEVRESA